MGAPWYTTSNIPWTDPTPKRTGWPAWAVALTYMAVGYAWLLGAGVVFYDDMAGLAVIPGVSLLGATSILLYLESRHHEQLGPGVAFVYLAVGYVWLMVSAFAFWGDPAMVAVVPGSGLLLATGVTLYLTRLSTEEVEAALAETGRGRPRGVVRRPRDLSLPHSQA